MKSLIYKTLLVAGISLAGVSCAKFDDDFNVNPANPSPNALQTRFLLANVLNYVDDVAFSNNAANFYVQYLAEGPYPGGSLYTTRNFDWNTFYTIPLYDLQTILNMIAANDPGAESGNGSHANQTAVANILQSYFFLFLTDRYGSIPYSQALQGSAGLSPVYDSQQEVYNSIFTKLTEASNSITATDAVTGDILLDGDMAAWQRFANTLRMKMALQLSEVDPAKGKTEFEAALAAPGGVISSNDENVVFNFLNDPNYFNPWYSNYTISARNDYAISTTLADYMLANGDERISVYAEELPGATPYRGLLYGSSQAKNIPNAYSRIGDDFRAATSPARIMNYPQVLFMMAEAAHLGYISGGDAAAEGYYTDAIQASWEMNGVYDAGAFAAYMAKVGFATGDPVERIITEKWVHNYLNGYEAWNDWRRTGYPALTPAEDGVDARGIPIRQGYPVSEGTLNMESYKAAVAAQGADDNYTPLWWDK